MNAIGIAVILGYLTLIIGTILYNGRKSKKSFKDYALAGGKLPWFVICGTIVASTIGGGSLMGFVGSFYEYGAMYFWMVIGSFASYLILIFFISGRINRLKVYTIADIFEMRYGKGAQLVSGFINMFVGVAVGFGMLSSFSSLLNSYIGIDANLSRIIGGLLFAITVTMGGLAGAAVTGTIQAVVVIGGALIISATAFTNAGGVQGLSQLPANLLDMGAQNIPPLLFWGMVASSFLGNFTDQAALFQRINAARTPKDAKKALILSTLMITFCMGLVMIMGLSSRIILGEGTGGNNVISELLKTMNPVISGVYVAAIIAAVVMTANAMYLSASMTFSKDLLKQFKPDLSDRAMVVSSRIFVWVMVAVGYVVITYQPSIMKWILIGYASLSCLALPLYGGLVTKKATPASGKWSLSLSIAGVMIWEILGSPWDINSLFIALILGIIGFVAGFGNKNGVTEEQLKLVDQFKCKVTDADNEVK